MATSDRGSPPLDDDENDAPAPRAYRAKGPTLGKGKACQGCRMKRTRCDGEKPSCAKCIQSGITCKYLERAQSSASTAALSERLASLQERYRMLSQVEAARTGQPPPDQYSADSAMQWGDRLSFNDLPPSPPAIRKLKDGDPLDDPYLDHSMTKGDRKTMLDLFAREAYRYMTIYVPPKLLGAIDDKDVSRRPHPCLVNAVVLVAQDFATTFPVGPVLDETGSRFVDFHLPDTVPSPDVLLARAQAQCIKSLAEVDRLQDYLQASILIALWFFRFGRLMEGQYTMASVVRLTVNCKLHRMDDAVIQEMAPRHAPVEEGKSFWDGSLLGRPQNIEELYWRIAIFWQSYYGDRTISLMSGLPATYDDSELVKIKTVWPRHVDEYISGMAFNVPAFTYEDLLNGKQPASRPADTPYTRLFKSVALLFHAVRMIGSPVVTQVQVDNLKRSIAIIQSSFDTLYDQNLLPTEAARSRARSYVEISFKALIQLYVYGAAIQATYIKPIDALPQDPERGLVERLEAARASSAVMAQAMEDMDKVATARSDSTRNGIEHMCFTSGMLMCAASGVLVDRIRDLEQQLAIASQLYPGGDEFVQDMQDRLQAEEQNLNTLLEGTDRVRETYPIVDVLLLRVQKLKAGLGRDEGQPGFLLRV